MSDPDLVARGKAVAEAISKLDAGEILLSDADWADIPPPPEPPPDETTHVVDTSGNGYHIAGRRPDVSRLAAHQRYPALDWHRVFAGAAPDIDWLVPEFVARGQSYSLVSQAKAGKSLLMLRRCGGRLRQANARPGCAGATTGAVRRPREHSR